MKGLDALAPKIIKQATGQLNQIAQRRIQQIIYQGGQQDNRLKKLHQKKKKRVQ